MFGLGQAAAPKKEESWEEAEARKAKAAWQAKFDAVNWSNTEEMYGIWPSYMQEQIKLAKVKNVTKSFEIWPFTLKSITGGILLNETELKIEQNRKYVLLGDNGTLSLFQFILVFLIISIRLFLSCFDWYWHFTWSHLVSFLDSVSGTGKTTLFDTMAHGGIKEIPKHISIHHCKEIEGGLDDAMTVLETVVRSNEWRNTLLMCHEQLKKHTLAYLAQAHPELAKEIADAEAANAAAGPKGEKVKVPSVSKEIKENPECKTLFGNLELVERQMHLIQSHTAYDRAAQMLRVLGFDDAAQQRSTNALSGGLRMRVALCCAFFIEPDLLLLVRVLDIMTLVWNSCLCTHTCCDGFVCVCVIAG